MRGAVLALLGMACGVGIGLLLPATYTAEARLAEVGLGGRGAALPRQLSLGQQRRLGPAHPRHRAVVVRKADPSPAALEQRAADEEPQPHAFIAVRPLGPLPSGGQVGLAQPAQ